MYWQEKAMGATSPGLRDTNVVLVDTSHRGLPKDSQIRFTLPSGVIDVWTASGTVCVPVPVRRLNWTISVWSAIYTSANSCVKKFTDCQ